MRNALLGLVLLGATVLGTSAQAVALPSQQTTVQPVYWSGEYCGPRCQAHQWRRHQRWEARRDYWRHRHWEERRYGYSQYPRY